MLDLFYPLVRPVLFSLDAERAHAGTLRLLGAAPRLAGRIASLTMGPPPPELAREAFGVRLGGPVGLAAGLDKDGIALPFWPSLGFGFVEVGTVTAHPQPGNPRPRLFRLPRERALINRMGFNNHGSTALATLLRALRDRDRWPAVPVGVNVGKSKVTPLDEAAADYATSVRRLQGLADYFAVNVSSPNTPGLRELQERAHLERVLGAVLEAARGTPVLLKLAPDLEEDALREAVSLAAEVGVRGIIATNTTVGREGLDRDPGEQGGLSGAPLWPRARRCIAVVLEEAAGRLSVVGVGGIEGSAQVLDLLEAGCAAVQVYTGLVYRGPGLPARINRDLRRRGSQAP